MTTSSKDLFKKLGFIDEETNTPVKPVEPTTERLINGLERLLEELGIEEEEQEKSDQDL